jgi:hypothetical protein
MYVCTYVCPALTPEQLRTLRSIYIITCTSDSRRGFGLDIGFIDHFNAWLLTALNYSAIADFHTLQVFSSPQCLH